MDIKMPTVDGIQAAERIFELHHKYRAAGKNLPELNLCAVTAYTDKTSIASARRAGFKEVL